MAAKENIKRVLSGGADLAIVQLDILDNMSYTKPAVLKKIAILLPIFKEEIHLVAQKAISSITDLAGKKVFFGEAGSGTAETSRILAGFLGLSLTSVEAKDSSLAEAKTSLVAGKLDAMFMVGGAPISTLQNLKGQVHLVPIKASSVQKIANQVSQYKAASIKANTYPWQADKVSTLAVHSVLISKASLSADEAVKLVNSILAKRAQLATAHAKWQELNLKSGGGFSGNTLSMVHPGVRDKIKF